MDNNVSDMIMVKQWYGVMVQHVWFAMDPGKICFCQDCSIDIKAESTCGSWTCTGVCFHPGTLMYLIN